MSDTITIEVKLDDLYVGGDKTFPEYVANLAAGRLVQKVVDDSHWAGLRARIEQITDDEIRAAIEPLVAEALGSEIEPVLGGARVPLRQHILDTAKKALTWREGSYESDRSMLTRLVRGEVDEVLAKELKGDLAEAKKRVREAVQAKGAEMLAQTIEQLAGAR